MAELDLQKLLAEATEQRSSITTALLAIQKSLDKMQPAVTKMEPVPTSLEPAVNELPAWGSGVDTAVGKPQTDIGDILGHLTKIATRSFPTSSSSTRAPSRCSTECLVRDDDWLQPMSAKSNESNVTHVVGVDNNVVDSIASLPSRGLTSSSPAITVVIPTASDVENVPEDALPATTVCSATAHNTCSTSGLGPTISTIQATVVPLYMAVVLPFDPRFPKSASSVMCNLPAAMTKMDSTALLKLLPTLEYPCDTSPSSVVTVRILSSDFTCYEFLTLPWDPGQQAIYLSALIHAQAYDANKAEFLPAVQVLGWDLISGIQHEKPWDPGTSLLTATSRITYMMGSMQDNFQLSLLFYLQCVQQTNAVFEAPPCWERHRIRIFWSGVAPGFLMTDLLQEDLNDKPKYSVPVTSRESRYELLHTSHLWRTSALCIFLGCSARFQWKVAWLFYHLHDCYLVALLGPPMPIKYFTQVLESTLLAGQLIQCDFKLNQWSQMGQLELEMVTLMTILKGEFTSRCLQIHPNKHAQVKFPWSSCYLFLQVGKLQDVMVELKTCFSVKWFLSAVTFLLNLHDMVCCNQAMSLQSLDIPFCMAEGFGMLIPVILTHMAWLLIISPPCGSPKYTQVWIGSILCIWTSHGAHIDEEYFSVQPPLMDQELGRTTEYWLLDIQGLSLADAFSEDSFWPDQHIIEACLASPYHRFMVAIAVEWLYTHNSYGTPIAVSNLLMGKLRVPSLVDGIDVTTSGYPLQANKIHYPWAEFVTTWLLGSDEIKCLEALASILQCTDIYLPVIMFDEIEPQLTVDWMKFVVQDEAVVVSNINKHTMVGTPVNHLYWEEYLICPSHNSSSAAEFTSRESKKLEFNNGNSCMVEQYTGVNFYMTKAGLHSLLVSISMAEQTSHRNNPIHQFVEQQLSFPASTCKHAHTYKLQFVEIKQRTPYVAIAHVTFSTVLQLGLSTLLGKGCTYAGKVSELPCTVLGSQKHPVPSVDHLMLKSVANELIAWVLCSLRTVVAYSSQCVFFTRLDGWTVMGQQNALGCTSLTGKQNLKEGRVSCLWSFSSIKSTSATSTTSTTTKYVPTMTTTSTTLASSTLIMSTAKATTSTLAMPWDPGGNSLASAWGQAEFEGGRNVTGTTPTKEAQGRATRPKWARRPNPRRHDLVYREAHRVEEKGDRRTEHRNRQPPLGVLSPPTPWL